MCPFAVCVARAYHEVMWNRAREEETRARAGTREGFSRSLSCQNSF